MNNVWSINTTKNHLRVKVVFSSQGAFDYLLSAAIVSGPTKPVAGIPLAV